MSRSQRDKGATFEREVAGILSEHLGRVVKRNLAQARDSGDDITLGKFRIECKRRRSISVYPWIDQALESCSSGEVPMVIARGDGYSPVVVMLLEDFLPMLSGEIGGDAK